MVVADIDEEHGHETVALVEASGGRATFVRTDVAVKDGRRGDGRPRRQLLRRPRLSPTTTPGSPLPWLALADYPDDGWDRTIAVMLTGVYLCMKAEIPRMLERGGGAIVNTASGVGLVGYPGQAAYTASKHGVVGLTKVAALDYGARGVRVNAICPGTARTPMVDQAVGHDPVHRRVPEDPAPDRPHRRGRRRSPRPRCGCARRRRRSCSAWPSRSTAGTWSREDVAARRGRWSGWPRRAI